MGTRKNFPSWVKRRREKALEQVERRLKGKDNLTAKQRENLEHEHSVLKDRISRG